MNDKIREIMTKLEEQKYIATPEIAYAVSGAFAGSPLEIEGDPGTGKTFLAAAIARAYQMPLIRVSFYEGLTYDKILYDYDYQRQILTIETIKSALENEMRGKSIEESMEIAKKIDFYGKDFLIERPVLKALTSKERCVLLLDEIDKASEEIEYTLLEVLDEFSMTIPQYGTIRCPEENRPVVFLTSNNYRELSDALKRRCNYLYIEPKTKEEVKKILLAQAQIRPEVAEGVASCMDSIRNLDMKQRPSISEAITWAQYINDNFDDSNKHDIDHTICMLAKNKEDRDTIKASGILQRTLLK